MSESAAHGRPAISRATRISAGSVSWGVDALWLFLLALAVRWPYLHLVPRYTDEVREIQWAVRIARGEHLPLAAHNGYAGPVWNYLLAGLMAVFGPSPGLPRATVLVAGCLTVVAAYVLGRKMAGRAAGGIAGLLMAASYVPVLVNSHVAWSASTLPLMTTLACIAALEAGRRGSGRWLVVAAGSVAIAAQVHPVAVLLVPGFGLWLAGRPGGRRVLRSRWAAASIAVGLLAYGNLLWFHAASRFETVRLALEKLGDGVPRDRTVAGYVDTLHAAVRNVVDMVAARSVSGWAPLGLDPALGAWVVALVLGGLLVLAARRGSSLPLVVTGTALLLVPLFNTAYGFPLGARYLALLLPLVYAAAGVCAVAALDALRRRSPSARRLGVAAVGAGIGAVMAVHIAALAGEYRSAEAAGRTNAHALEILAAARDAQRQGPSTVLWSDRIDAKFDGGGHLHRVFAALLALAEVPNERIRDDLTGLDEQIERCRPHCLLILAEHHLSSVELVHDLEPVPMRLAPRAEDGEAYGLYRLGTR